MSTVAPIKIFVSHSGHDSGLARALVDLLRAALRLSSSDIRCTSVDGYRLPVGMPIADKLRAEVHDAEALIALLTRNSLASSYFLFELGARWGAKRPLYPLYAGGATPHDVNAWLGDFHGASLGVTAQIMQFIRELADSLRLAPDSADSYLGAVQQLVSESEKAAANALEAYGLADPAERERQEAAMKAEEGSTQAGHDQAIFWEALRSYYADTYRQKDNPDFPESLEGLVEAAGAPPNTIDADLFAWPRLYEARLNVDQRRLWAFVRRVYPPRDAGQPGDVWQYSAIKPGAAAEACHWARRNLAKYWDTWPPLVGYSFILDRFATKRHIIQLLAWLELALVQWTRMPGKGKQELFKLAERFK
jgi:hypothetical protein